MRGWRVLILAQTPPPYHGQAVMQQHLVESEWSWCSIEHIRLRYSERIEEVGSFSVRKVLHLFGVILRVWRARLIGPIDILYYPPAGPHRIPFLRDLVTLLATRWLAHRLVLHFHAGGFDRLPRIVSAPERVLARLAYGNADLAIVPAASLAEEVAWVRPRRMATVPNGVPDFSRTRARVADPVCRRILYAGSLTPEKGVLDLVRAFREILREGFQPLLVLAGGFRSREFEQTVLEYIHTERLQAHLHFAGVLDREDLEQEYRRSDVFCFPTNDTEAMPMVLLEAMREGLPIVTTRWRSLPEIVGDSALLVPPGNAGALTAALKELLQSPERRRELGCGARRRFERFYTLSHHREGIDAAFRAVAER